MPLRRCAADGMGDPWHGVNINISYLDSLSRITNVRYIPDDDDVLKARLKTVGVVEHCFSLETGKQKGVDWKIYDVGGLVLRFPILFICFIFPFLVREIRYCKPVPGEVCFLK